MAFLFENLEVYKRAILFISDINTLVERESSPTLNVLTDQLFRASLSISINIARWNKADKHNFFWIARRSVYECIPLIEILKTRGSISDEENDMLRTKLEVLEKMLTRLIQVHT